MPPTINYCFESVAAIEGVSGKRGQVPLENLGYHMVGIKQNIRDIIKLLWYLLKTNLRLP